MNNTSNPITTITRVLDIIDYQGDKEKYANELLNICLIKTIDGLSSSLPEDKQQDIVQKLEAEQDPNQKWLLLQSQFGQDEFTSKFKVVCHDTFIELAKALEPTLSEQMKLELKAYSTTLSQTNSQNSSV